MVDKPAAQKNNLPKIKEAGSTNAGSPSGPVGNVSGYEPKNLPPYKSKNSGSGRKASKRAVIIKTYKKLYCTLPSNKAAPRKNSRHGSNVIAMGIIKLPNPVNPNKTI